MAGRDRARLEALASQLEARGGRRPGVLVADVGDAAALAEMARSTVRACKGCAPGTAAQPPAHSSTTHHPPLPPPQRVLINTVGPFRRYGRPVVAACVEAGTDYLDVCGEPGECVFVCER